MIANWLMLMIKTIKTINALVLLLYQVDMKHKQIKSDVKTNNKSINNIIGRCYLYLFLLLL